MRIRTFPRTHAGMVIIFGGIAFGGGLALVTHHSFPRMWNTSFPGILIPIASCFAVGLCWGEAVWQFRNRIRASNGK
jgi:hypothetical protein